MPQLLPPAGQFTGGGLPGGPAAPPVPAGPNREGTGAPPDGSGLQPVLSQFRSDSTGGDNGGAVANVLRPRMMLNETMREVGHVL